ncbi:sodium:proton antiporter [alpha proteobacterium AAP81b]|nr:sodium:proton antiporter [alpha proteobacterium AAP81b]
MPSLRAPTAIRRFLANEAAGGWLLIAAAVAALAIANSDASAAYTHALHIEIAGLSLLHWINDGLMAIFFLYVGCEVKRELIDGELSTWSRRLLPGAAALGGMVVPALVYAVINRGLPQNAAGWAIPTATDIAFALGVVALLGKRVPASLKLLLTALAIIDDLGAIAIIALVYTKGLDMVALAAAGAGLALLITLNRLKVQSLKPYLLVGAGVWYAVLQSGIHATLAGVAIAFCIPLARTRGTPEARDTPLIRLEHALSPLVAFVIVPVFGFANAGVDVRGLGVDELLAPLPIGVVAGLVLGKPLGVFGAMVLTCRWARVDMPAGASWRQLFGLACLAGIGFTMSLFISGLAFGEGTLRNDEAKLGILLGSVASALLGAGGLLRRPRPA